MVEITGVRQKGGSRNRCFKITKHIKFSEKQGKKRSFFGKFAVLGFLETPFSRFALLPYYRQVIVLERILYKIRKIDKRYTNADLKISLHVLINMKVIP